MTGAMDIRLKKKKRRWPRIFSQRAIEEALRPIIRANSSLTVARQEMQSLNDAAVVVVDAHSYISNAIVGILRLNGIYDEMVLFYRMAQMFPWNERMVTRSQHLHFVWLLFVNHCYAFEGKFKLAANEHNKAVRAYKASNGIDVKSGMKRIKQGIGEHIRNRGEHTHQWRKTHDIVDDFGLIELASSLAEMPGLPSMKVVRNWPKMVLAVEMQQAIAFMEEILLEVIVAHKASLLPVSKQLAKQLKAARRER